MTRKPTRPAVDVARGASSLIIGNLTVSTISILAFAVMARLISREEMGALAVLTLVASAAQLLAGLGVGATATKFIGGLQLGVAREEMRTAAYECLTINLLGTVLLMVAVYFSSGLLASQFLGSTTQTNLIQLLVIDVGALCINYSLSAILAGLKMFKEWSVARTATFAIRQGLVVALLLLGFGLPGVLLGWGIGDAASSLTMGLLIRRHLGGFRVGSGFRRILKFSGPLFAGELATFAWSWFDRALLVPLVSLADLGTYNVAVTAYGVLAGFSQSISGTLFPFYSGIYQGEGSTTGELEGAIKTASRYVSFFTIPLAVGLAVTAAPAATLLAGNLYADAALPLAILALSLAVGCFIRALGAILIVLERTVTSALVTIASIFLPILVGFLIIPILGILGASIARGASLIISLILSILILRKVIHVRVRFDTGAYAKTWIASLMMAAAVLASELLYTSKLLLPLYVAVGGVVFLIALRMLRAVNQEDYDLVSEFLGPRFRVVTNVLGRVLLVRGHAEFHDA